MTKEQDLARDIIEALRADDCFSGWFGRDSTGKISPPVLAMDVLSAEAIVEKIVLSFLDARDTSALRDTIEKGLAGKLPVPIVWDGNWGRVPHKE